MAGHHYLYHTWWNMHRRCENEEAYNYDSYGGRGITVCARWLECFENFWEDMGGSYQSGLTLDRIDNTAGYHKENCAWRTWEHQANNRRSSLMIQTPLGEMTAAKAADAFKMNRTTLYYRLAHGWNPLDAISTPTAKFMIS